MANLLIYLHFSIKINREIQRRVDKQISNKIEISSLQSTQIFRENWTFWNKTDYFIFKSVMSHPSSLLKPILTKTLRLV